MSRAIERRYQQRVGSKRLMSRDCVDALDILSTTLVSVAAQNVASGLSITTPASTSTGWSGLLSATYAGAYTFELLWTFANGEVIAEEFAVVVIDADGR